MAELLEVVDRAAILIGQKVLGGQVVGWEGKDSLPVVKEFLVLEVFVVGDFESNFLVVMGERAVVTQLALSSDEEFASNCLVVLEFLRLKATVAVVV